MLVATLGAFLAFVDARPRATLTTDVESDPFAHRDPYLNLTSDELHAHWSGNEDLYHEDDLGHALRGRAHTLAERLAMLDALHETTYVDVRLAGFAGDGEHEIHLDEDKVQRLLDATLHEEPQFVVHPPASSASHELPVRRRFLFRVTSAAPALAPSIAAAIESHIASGGSPDAVPLGLVDALVRDDYMHQRGSHVTLYLLSPRAPRREPTAFEMLQASGGASFGAAADANSSSIASKWWQKVRYMYLDGGSGNATAVEGGGGGGGGGVCPVARWVGRERYMWVDLSAGPISYGPATAADDVVTDHSLPSIMQLSRRFSERAELSKHLAVELAALTLNTARMLLAPPVSRLQPPPPSVLTTTPSALTTTPSALTIVALRISDRADAAVGSSAMARSALNEAELADDRAWEAELENLKTELRPLAAHGQTLTIESVDTSLEDCHLCAAALSTAIKAGANFVSTPLAGTGSTGAVSGQVLGHVRAHDVIDSRLLASSIRAGLTVARDLKEAMPQGRTGALTQLPIRAARPNERLLPVVVYSLSTAEPVLLDGLHVALPFSELVLAVQTRPPAGAGTASSSAPALPPPPPPSLLLDEQCQGMAISLHADSLARPLLSALLQSGWGIVPTGTTWSAAHNATVTRLLWSSAHTPHGPYSARATLSFAQRDAAVRAPLYARITEALAEVRQLAAHFSEFGKTIDEVLRPAEHLTFLRRLNLLAYKLQRVRSFLSLQNFRHAQYYVLSTRHDLRAMRTVLEQAGAMLKAGLVCDV